MDRFVVSLSFLSLMFTFACSGEQTGSLPSLIRLEEQPPGPSCSTGGTAVYTGVDDNGDGALSAAEIDQTVFVCNGAEGPTATGADALVRTETVATGTVCTHGGIAIHSGSDLDRDGVLDDTEITNTEHVCNSPGATGTDALVRTATVATGTVCPHGGVVIHSGSDLDSDGTLDASEISASEYLCNTPPGTSGTAALVRLEPVPTGTVCPNGGVAIHTGPDLDANGALASDEITDTEYVCYGQPGSAGTNGFTALVRLEPVPTGTICPNGGVAVQTGTDLDEDGQLAPSEVTGTQYVCYGADGQAGATGSPGTAALIRLDDVTTGTICSGGGVAVNSGLDLDGDGTLSNNEIIDTDYICSGTPGQTALLRLDPVPAGAYCVNGGVAVNAGLDQDGDGYLDNEEITDTEYICNGTSGTVPPQDFQGSFVIRNSLDVSTIMPYTSISGNLTIEGAGLSAVNLPNLTNIGGKLVVNNTQLTDLMMNALGAVGGRIEIKSNSVLTSFSFAALTSAGELQIWQNTVSQIVFPSLLTIATECRIFDNDQLTLVRFSSATQIGSVIFDDNDALNIIDFPALNRVTGDLTLHGAVGCLATLPLLTRVDGTMTIAAEASAGVLSWAGGLQLNCRAGEVVSLPALTTVQGLVRFACNTVDVSQLRSAGEIYVAQETPGDTYDFTPALETVTNDFLIYARTVQGQRVGSIRHIQLPSLRTVGGGFMDFDTTDVVEATYLIDTLNAPVLETVGEDIELNMASTSIANLPSLTSVAGLMWVISGDFHAPNLSNLGSFNLTGEEISNLQFPSLLTVGDMSVLHSLNVVSISMPVLSAIQGNARFQLPSLQSISMSAIETINRLSFSDTNITTFDAPLLTTITDAVYFSHNSSLSSFNMPNWTTGGLLSVSWGMPPTLSFPALTSGEIILRYGGATSLYLPNFSSGALTAYRSSLQAIDLPSFTNGDITLEIMQSLQSLSIPNFTSGDIELRSLPVQSIDLSNLSHGNLDFNGVPLTTVGSLSNLTTGGLIFQHMGSFQMPLDLSSMTNGSIYFNEVPNLPSITAPVLQNLGQLFVDTTGVTTIDLPSLTTTGRIYIRDNPALSSLTMPSLTTVGDPMTNDGPVYINNGNVSLPRSDVQAIIDQLIAAGWTGS